MSEHIGIVACGAEGAALCYRIICQEAPALMGGKNLGELGTVLDFVTLGEEMMLGFTW